ncbi:MAG: recombinase family protein [Ruminococcus sp.]|nr:recombinase family protein [Ruminococcus sp.]
MIEKKIKAAALYARFSRNDSNEESDSIDNQRKILQKYAEENGFTRRTKFYAEA